MKFPVFRTTWEVLDYCWRERKLAVRFAALPLIIIVGLNLTVLAVLGTAALDVPEESLTDPQAMILSLAVSVVQMIVYLPLSVTWLRLVVLGEAAARSRSIFTFGSAERRFFGWQLLCLLAVFVVVGIGAGITLALQAVINDMRLLGETARMLVALAAIGWTFVWVAGLIMGLVRMTMIFVFAALDQPVTFKEAWIMTRGLSWLLFRSTVLLILASVVVSLLFKLIGFILSAVAAIGTDTGISPIMAVVTTIGANITRLMFWLTAATLYGLVYKMIVKDVPVPAPKA